MTDWTTPEDVPEVVRERLHDWLNTGNPAHATTLANFAVAEVIRSFWPVPARTLAEELRSWAEDASYDEDRDNLLHAADRAEQMEQDAEERQEWNLRITEQVATLASERDEARAEVERLNREQGRLHAQVQGLARRDGCHNSEVRMLTEERDEALAEVESVRSELAEVTHARDSLREDYDHASAEVKRERDLGVALAHERDDTRAELERVRNAVDPEGAGLPPGMTISEAVQALIDGIPTGERVGLTDAQLKREYDLTEARAEVERLRHNIDEAYKTRDARDDDVARLTAERDTMSAMVDSLNNDLAELRGPQTMPVHPSGQQPNTQGILAGSLPDPADVKPGEAWLVECRGERRTAVKDNDDTVPWCTVNADGWFNAEKNAAVTPVSRLVPAPRVITNPDELDALPVCTILRDEDGAAWHRTNDQWTTTAEYSTFTSRAVLCSGPVTVLWEPEA